MFYVQQCYLKHCKILAELAWLRWSEHTLCHILHPDASVTNAGLRVYKYVGQEIAQLPF